MNVIIQATISCYILFYKAQVVRKTIYSQLYCCLNCFCYDKKSCQKVLTRKVVNGNVGYDKESCQFCIIMR